jgi:acetolactate synthase-1/2/3 large subunit
VNALIGRLSGQQSKRPNRVGEVSLLKEQVCDIWQQQLPLEFQLIRDIRAALPRDTIFSLEPTMGAYSAWQMLDLYEPRSYLYPMLGATLGYSLPAALGAKVANPDRPVVTICGDGGFMLCCQELATAVQYGINTVTLLFNDNGYGVLRIQQDARFGRRSEVDLVNPDFVALARSFGVESMRIDEPGHLKAALAAAIEADRPTLIEMPIALAVQWD